MEKLTHREKTEAATSSELEVSSEKERKRSKSVDSRGSSISSEVDNEALKGARRRSKESTISEERTVSERISKAIEEEDAFLDYIKGLPAMSNEKVEAYKKSQSPIYKRSTSEVSGGLEHLDNLYRLMEHMGQLRIQNSKLQERVKYLENMAHEDVVTSQKEETEADESKLHSRSKRSTKCKSSHYGIRHTFMKSTRERSRSVGVEEIMKSTAQYRLAGTHDFESRGSGNVKAKVSKWTKVKEAFRWEKASNGVLPEAKSQDSGLGASEDVRFLRVPHTLSDNSSSFSVSPADSVLSGQSLSQPSGKDCLSMPHISSSASTSEEDLADPNFGVDTGMPTCSFRRDCEDPRRSKSLDGDCHLIPCDLLEHESGKDHKGVHTHHKGIRTPWGKMKDIIQTRTGSLKKKKGDSDIEEDARSGVISEDARLEDSHYEIEASPDIQITECDESDVLAKSHDKCFKRRLAPMLTITLPSTEELHGGAEGPANSTATATTTKVSAKPPPSPQIDERHLKASGKPKGHEEAIAIKDNGFHHLPRKISGGSAGTSPPTPHRLSKWSKVKNAFLTSGSASEDCLHRGSSSVPSSPVKSTTFVYDIESDELSSGEFMDDSARDDDVFPESVEEMSELIKHETIQAEIQRNYEELQLKLSQEFHKKLCEWEKIKSSASPGTPPCNSRVGGSGFSSGTSSVGDDSPHDKGFRKKMEEWEKIRSPSSGGAKHRESVTLQHLGEENLSADFRKKLEEWEKIKNVPQTPDVVNVQQPHLKKKITDWQLWKPGVMTSKSDAGLAGMATPPIELPEDFYKKLQEWERLKHGSTSSAHPETESPGNKTPSPGCSRRECSKTQHSPTSKKEKGNTDFGFHVKIQKSKSHHEVKELAWLEKELHKVEREKQRLERERDKYLEREARLEKLRKAIGANLKKQEILIPTSTGLFRFEGISQKFTRKLYEWEKAKGIGPEASTFALLDPGYQPPGSSPESHGPDGLVGNASLLTRSKSMGSVVDIVALAGGQGPLTHQPSSLSLNHMEQLETNHRGCALRESEEMGEDEEEPQAVIVDVEDVIEETASPLEHTPAVQTETPVYCYAPTEVTRLIDSSGSDSDKDVNRLGGPAQSSIQLLQENINLLDKLQRKESICRELECKIEDVEDKLNTTDRIHREHLGTLVQDQDQFLKKPLVKEQSLEQIKEKLLELESQQERLLEEGTTLQHSFVEHSEEHALLAQDLVGKVKQLQDNITTTTVGDQDNGGGGQQGSRCGGEGGSEDCGQQTLGKVQELTSQLLNLAEKLEVAVSERNQEISLLRKALGSNDRSTSMQKLRLTQQWFSSDSVSTIGVTERFANHPGSEELTGLPVLLTHKLQELNSCLSSLAPTPQADGRAPSAVSTKQVLNIIYPDSPEIETTFVFNIGKKPVKENVELEVLPPVVCPNELEHDDVEITNESHQPEASFTFKPTMGSSVNQSEYATPADITKINSLNITPDDEKKNRNFESVVELTYPLKTYFKEDNREKRPMNKAGHFTSDSDDTDYDTNVLKRVKPKETAEASEQENFKDSLTTKKFKRNRHNSGLLERRRSRTESKDENSDEEAENMGLFEACTSKKSLNYDTRYKKATKSKTLFKENDCSEKKGKRDVENIDMGAEDFDIDNPIESSSGVKPLTSPKCISRRNKKSSKGSKEEKSSSESRCISYKYCCNAEDENIVPDQEMTVNVFVPTTRKIFSPVRKDSKGETSTVISYVVEEPAPSCSEQSKDQVDADTHRSIKKNFKIERSKNCDEKSHCPDSKIVSVPHKKEKFADYDSISNDNQEETKQKFDFIMPPCWIIKQARAQSASPSLQRRTLQKSLSKEKGPDKEVSDKTNEGKRGNTRASNTVSSDDTLMSVSNDNNKISDTPNEPEISNKVSVNQHSFQTDSNHQKDGVFKDNCRKNSSSSESVENNRPFRKEGTSIPSSLKLRSEAGFPPISPLTVRREMKVLKETAPSIRMMIAKYNQKVHESQELSGTKSPESGGQSPIAWRSPVAERRIKAQMEKYQEEVRKALQNSARKDFYPHARLGQVQKSASAGYIRPFDKGLSSESINERSEDKSLPQSSQYHGILKSSSAGAIKSFSPLPTKRQIRKHSDLSLNTDCSVLTTNNFLLEPKKEESKINDSYPQLSETNESLNPSVSVISTELEKLKVPHIPPIPTSLSDDFNDALQPDPSLESTRVRALKIKRAKEEFLSRGCVQDGNTNYSQGLQNSPSTPDASVPHERLTWKDSKSRLSQMSCGSESSYENVPMIVVSGKESSREHDGTLLVKSASAGMINIDSASSSRVFCEPPTAPGTSDQGTIPKSKSGILSRFRKARLKRSKEKENSKLDTVSTLCRQSLVVDINKRNQNGGDPIPPTSKSCPSSPVLHKRDQPPSGSWIRNPRNIFKPK